MSKASLKRQKIDTPTNSSINPCDEIKVCTTKRKRTRRSLPKDSPSQRSSVYRGVTRHRWTGRYEAHLWDKDCLSGAQKKKKGRQVYLGAYDDEVTAARAYDLAALKYWGKNTILNFPVSNYEKEMEEMEAVSREEYIGSLRRKSSGFSRGVSKYRGVARHHHNGRWEARIGRVNGNKYLYLGTYATQEEAATAYDIAAIEHRGPNAVTNFDLSHYINLIKPYNNNNDQTNEPTKSIENSVSSTTSSPITFGEDKFGRIYDGFEESDVNIDVDMFWGEPLLGHSTSTLLELDECNMLQFQPSDYGPGSFLKSQSSPSVGFGSDEEGFFSELNSFLCDFDEVQKEFGK